MKKFTALLLLFAVWLGGCSAREDKVAAIPGPDVIVPNVVDPDNPTDPVPDPPAATLAAVGGVRVVSADPTIVTGGTGTVAITAIVTDSSNRALAGRVVTFQADRGALQNIEVETNESGVVSTLLTLAGDYRNQNVLVSAASEGVRGQSRVAAFGSAIGIDGPAEVAAGGSATLVMTLIAGTGVGIPNQSIEIVSSAGNPIVTSSTVTDASGQVHLQVGSSAGSDSIQFSALEGTATTQYSLRVSDTVAPTDPTIIVPVGGVRVISEESRILTGGTGKVTVTAVVTDDENRALEGRIVKFSSNRGALQNIQSTTNASGEVTAELSLAGDARNQNIVVVAESENVSGETLVAAFGSSLAASGPTAIATGQGATIVATLTAGTGTGIPNQLIAVDSAAGYDYNSDNLVTDANGRITVIVGPATQDDTVTLTALDGSVVGTYALTISDTGDPTDPPVSAVGDVRVVSAEPRIVTGGTGTVEITAVVTDASNRALAGRSVSFSSDRGALQNIVSTTNDSGEATAELNLAGDVRNQNIAVFAESETVIGQSLVAAYGSSLVIDAPAEVVADQSATILVTLLAGNGSPIPNELVEVVSNVGNDFFIDGNQVTDADGNVTVSLEVAKGSDTLTFRALSSTVTAVHEVVVVESEQSVITPVKIRVISNASIIETGGSDTAKITALVTDEDNRVVEGQVVDFSSTGGVLQNIAAITNSAGQASAELNLAGDYRNQNITVTAATGDQAETVSIQAGGSTVSVAGPTSLVSGNVAELTVTLTSGNGQPISNHQLQLTSLAGNSLNPATLTTDASGKATVMVGSTQGDDTITVTALEGTATIEHAINVADDILSIVEPSAGTELEVGTSNTIEVLWTSNGIPVANQVLNFSITAGELSSPVATTDVDGIAQITVTSTSSGPATIAVEDASDADPATQIAVEFVAKDVAAVMVSAAPASVSTNNESVISGVVTDAVGNPVKGVVVSFFSDDLKGGNLSPVSAMTDSDGRARVTFTAGTLPTEVDEIVITAQAVDEDSDVTDVVALTVTEQQLNVIIGLAGVVVEADSDTRYLRAGVVQVTDGSGTPVPEATIQVTAIPIFYRYGQLITVDADNNGEHDSWALTAGNFFTCEAEDINGNRILDGDEDDNLNSVLDPQDPALIQADPGNVPTVVGGEITTDANGVGFFSVAYPQSNGLWFAVDITATAQALGAESAASYAHVLGAAASDMANEDVSPPNQVSPYGGYNPAVGVPQCDPF